MKKIRRFPRLPEDYPELAKKKFLGVDITNGRIPYGYDKVSKRQKKAIRYIVNGMTLKDMCRKIGTDTNTWYRWYHLNEKFRKYYHDYAARQSQLVAGRLDAKTGRAVQVVEEALDGPDPYLAADQAVKLLSGRGLYTKQIKSDRHVSGAIMHGHAGAIGHKIEVVDKELMQAFVEAMTGRAIGAPEKKEKIIDAKVLKQLPEPKNVVTPQVQKSVEAEVV